VAPWWIVEGTDERHRNLSVARALLAALEARLNGGSRPAPPQPVPTPLIVESLYSAIVVMALVTTVITPILLKGLFRPSDLLRRKSE